MFAISPHTNILVWSEGDKIAKILITHIRRVILWVSLFSFDFFSFLTLLLFLSPFSSFLVMMGTIKKMISQTGSLPQGGKVGSAWDMFCMNTSGEIVQCLYRLQCPNVPEDWMLFPNSPVVALFCHHGSVESFIFPLSC